MSRRAGSWIRPFLGYGMVILLDKLGAQRRGESRGKEDSRKKSRARGLVNWLGLGYTLCTLAQSDPCWGIVYSLIGAVAAFSVA